MARAAFGRLRPITGKFLRNPAQNPTVFFFVFVFFFVELLGSLESASVAVPPESASVEAVEAIGAVLGRICVPSGNG